MKKRKHAQQNNGPHSDPEPKCPISRSKWPNKVSRFLGQNGPKTITIVSMKICVSNYPGSQKKLPKRSISVYSFLFPFCLQTIIVIIFLIFVGVFLSHTTCIISRLLCFIEVLWDLAGLECVDCAEDDQDHVVEQRHDDRERGHLLIVMLGMIWML